jgi:RNA polymerase sigma-70 factor (ECF subfamily)
VAEAQGVVRAFLAELADGANAGGTPRDLASDLAAACARGRGASRQLALDDATFARYLARVLKDSSKSPATIRGLPVEDLYLACACCERLEAALAAFRARYRPTIHESVKAVIPTAEVEDVREQFLEEMLVGTGAAPPKIGTYLGKASLARWVNIGARRAALMWLRKNQAEGRVRRAVASDPTAKNEANVEATYIKERYRREFEQALAQALKRLPERDVVVLRLCLVNGVSVEKIGKMYKVSQSTISRWLAAAKATLLADVKKTLRRQLGTSSNELASLARMVASRLDLTLTSVLERQ